MKHNMGTADRILRAIVGLLLGYLIITNKVDGVLALILGIFGIMLLLTSAIGYCPPYSAMGISTCGCDEHSKGG